MFNAIIKLMNFRRWFKRTDKSEALHATDQALADHIIALARLMPIRPERLVEEARNIQANADYLLKMSQVDKPKPV